MDKVKTQEVWAYQRDYNIKAHTSKPLNSKDLRKVKVIFKNEPARRHSIRGFSLKGRGAL